MSWFSPFSSWKTGPGSCRAAKMACLCVPLVSPHALILLGTSGTREAPWYHNSSFLQKVLLVLLSRYVAFGEVRTLPAVSETCSPRHFLLALCVSWAHAISAHVCVMTSYSTHLCRGLSLVSELFSPEMLASECLQEQPPANGWLSGLLCEVLIRSQAHWRPRCPQE